MGSMGLVKSLGDQVFVLSSNCSFSVSAREFSGYIWDYIHFTDDNHQRLVFHLKDPSVHDMQTTPRQKTNNQFNAAYSNATKIKCSLYLLLPICRQHQNTQTKNQLHAAYSDPWLQFHPRSRI
jgi:hypothetical protein